MILKTREGRYILQQRSLKAKYYPGEWDVTGGGTRAGESTREAAAREAFEELGVRIAPEGLTHMLTEITDWPHGGLIIDTWAGICEIPQEGLHFDPYEVNAVRLVDFTTFRDTVCYNKTNTFRAMLERVDREI